jgi:septum site-determining protein MinC
MNFSSAASDGHPPATAPVILRGTSRGFEVVVDPAASIDDVVRELEGKLNESPSFFAGNDVVFRCAAPLPAGGLTRLEAVARQFALRIIEVGPGAPPRSPRRPQLALERGPGANPESPPAGPEGAAPVAAGAAADVTALTGLAAAAGQAELPDRTRFIVGPVRSGSVLEAQGHLVVLGDVNPGAEVRAALSVVVLGALRGIAHAGQQGGAAFIFALRLAPQQLRIGDHIARAVDAPYAADAPEIAYAANGRIMVEQYRGKLPGGITAADL